MGCKFGCSSNILHPLTEVKDQNCSNGQQAKFVDRSSILSPDKTQDIKIQASYDLIQSSFDCSLTILHPLTEVKGQKNCSNGQQAKFVDRSSILSPDKTQEQNNELEGVLLWDMII